MYMYIYTHTQTAPNSYVYVYIQSAPSEADCFSLSLSLSHARWFCLRRLSHVYNCLYCSEAKFTFFTTGFFFCFRGTIESVRRWLPPPDSVLPDIKRVAAWLPDISVCISVPDRVADAEEEEAAWLPDTNIKWVEPLGAEAEAVAAHITERDSEGAQHAADVARLAASDRNLASIVGSCLEMAPERSLEMAPERSESSQPVVSPSAPVSPTDPQHTPARMSIREHTSALVSPLGQTVCSRAATLLVGEVRGGGGTPAQALSEDKKMPRKLESEFERTYFEYSYDRYDVYACVYECVYVYICNIYNMYDVYICNM